MLIPISKLIEDDGKTTYNLYDSDSGKVLTNWTPKKLKDALEDGNPRIIGFTIPGGQQPRLIRWFQDIGIAGKDQGENHYILVKRILNVNTTRFVIVNVVGKDFELEKSGLVEFIRQGNVVSGVRLGENDTVTFCKEIPTVVMK